MKRAFLMILALCLLAALAGCGSKAPDNSPAQTTNPVSSDTPANSTAPDFGSADFSGHWAVSEVYDSAGEQVTGPAFDALDTGFMLELLTDGVYFVYDDAGAVLGQGTYAVNGDLLTLTAGSAQTVYTITDVDTLRATAPDSSVTVMSRQPEEAPEVTVPEDGEDTEDGDAPESGETESPEDETEPDDTGF